MSLSRGFREAVLVYGPAGPQRSSGQVNEGDKLTVGRQRKQRRGRLGPSPSWFTPLG